MTINNLKLVGDRVVIQLDEAQDHTITEGGIVIPLNNLEESEAGRVTTRTSSQRHLLQGTVLALTKSSQEKLFEQGITLKASDRVFVPSQVLNATYHFYLDRSRLVQDFKGIISIPHSLIEAKIIETDESI